MAGARGPTVMLHTPSSAFFRSWAPWTKSPETLTSAASGARRRKVTDRSGATSQELYAGGALPRPPRPPRPAGTCAGRSGVSIKGMANSDSLDMPRIVAIGAAQGHAGTRVKCGRYGIEDALVALTRWLLAVWSGFLGRGRHRSEERRVGKECRSRWSPNK